MMSCKIQIIILRSWVTSKNAVRNATVAAAFIQWLSQSRRDSLQYFICTHLAYLKMNCWNKQLRSLSWSRIQPSVMQSSLLALLIAFFAILGAQSFTLSTVKYSTPRLSSSLSDSVEKLPEIVEVKVIVSGKNVQGPWYRTTVRHEVSQLSHIFMRQPDKT